ncbi:hypothetical protein GCM10020218_018360 [Dactylosporangium vinaceum]
MPWWCTRHYEFGGWVVASRTAGGVVESRAAASPGRPWFTLEHNTAVAAAYVLIRAEVPACNAGWVCYLSPETVIGGLLLAGVAVGVAILIAPEVAAGAAAVAGAGTLGGVAYGFAGAV